MQTAEVRIEQWEATPEVLMVRVEVDALPWVGGTFYRHLNWGPGESRDQWGWYFNAAGGSRPERDGFDELMNALVLEHDVLSSVASRYDIKEADF